MLRSQRKPHWASFPDLVVSNAFQNWTDKTIILIWLVVYLPLWKMMDFVTWAHETPNIWKVIKFHGSKPPINHVIMFVYVYLKCCSNIGLILQQHILSLDFWNRLPSVGPGEVWNWGRPDSSGWSSSSSSSSSWCSVVNICITVIWYNYKYIYIHMCHSYMVWHHQRISLSEPPGLSPTFFEKKLREKYSLTCWKLLGSGPGGVYCDQPHSSW